MIRIRSATTRRNVILKDNRTSMSLEREMWDALDEAAENKKISNDELIARIAENKAANMNLSAAVRVFLMLYYRNRRLNSV